MFKYTILASILISSIIIQTANSDPGGRDSDSDSSVLIRKKPSKLNFFIYDSEEDSIPGDLDLDRFNGAVDLSPVLRKKSHKPRFTIFDSEEESCTGKVSVVSSEHTGRKSRQNIPHPEENEKDSSSFVEGSSSGEDEDMSENDIAEHFRGVTWTIGDLRTIVHLKKVHKMRRKQIAQRMSDEKGVKVSSEVIRYLTAKYALGPLRKRRLWSESDLQHIKRAKKKGKKHAEIAALMSRKKGQEITGSQIDDASKKYHLGRQRTSEAVQWTDGRLKRLKALRGVGLGSKDIADILSEEFGLPVTAHSVEGQCQKHKIPLAGFERVKWGPELVARLKELSSPARREPRLTYKEIAGILSEEFGYKINSTMISLKMHALGLSRKLKTPRIKWTVERMRAVRRLVRLKCDIEYIARHMTQKLGFSISKQKIVSLLQRHSEFFGSRSVVVRNESEEKEDDSGDIIMTEARDSEEEKPTEIEQTEARSSSALSAQNKRGVKRKSMGSNQRKVKVKSEPQPQRKKKRGGRRKIIEDTAENIATIKALASENTYEKVAALLTEKWGRTITRSQISKFVRRNNLTKSRYVKWTEERIAFVRQKRSEGCTLKKIAEELSAKLGQTVTDEAVSNICVKRKIEGKKPKRRWIYYPRENR